MKISKNSWHYRLLKWSFSNEKLVGFTHKGIRYETAEEMKLAIGRGPCQEIGESLPSMSLCRYCRELFLAFLSLPFRGILLVVCMICFIIILAVEYVWEKLHDPNPYQDITPVKESIAPKEPKTLLGKWLKSKKEKICPLLEYE